ncbi:MAG: acetolactate decarboxylase [Desulfarculus sp.]|nr:acetolactate decarboxylase [Desulfarculus sp.]
MPQRMLKPLGRRLAPCALALWAALLWGCAHGSLEGEGEVTLFQVSTIDALMEGVYEGQVSFARLAREGDLGIGTFHELDGELVALDGEFYQVKSSGQVLPVDPAMKTPYADVVRFRPQRVVQLKGTFNVDELCQAIDQELASLNLFHAVRIDGFYQDIKARAVAAQQRPYPKLVEAAKGQGMFRFQDLKGTVLGIRSPLYAKGISVPGWHLHFIDQSRTSAGHVMDLAIKDPKVQVMTINKFAMLLPDKGEFLNSDLVTDKSEDLRTVEKGR